MIHLEGMGVVGSMLARLLRAREIEFTWHDIETERVAWRACTGVIYQSGERVDNECYDWWRTQLHRGDRFAGLMWPYMESAVWCYFSQHAPHGGASRGIRTMEEIGGVRVSNVNSLHMNAQQLVMATRLMFAKNRLSKEDSVRVRSIAPATQYVVTHGFHTQTIGAWSWGWTAEVTLDVHPVLREACGDARPCFYMRNGYVLDYLYPTPGQPTWYAGTTLCTQKQPRSLEIEPKVKAWRERMEDKLGSAARIVAINRPVEGWRPVPRAETPLLTQKANTFYIRPQYGSGIRHFPLVVKELEQAGILT